MRWIWSVMACIVATAGPASPQEPTGPPPPSSTARDPGSHVHELLPDLGRIGAQAGLRIGSAWNPYEVGRGLQWGGYVDLPLVRVPGGKLSYEILISLSDGESQPFAVTDSVAYLANLASGASPAAALAGPPLAPFPVVRAVRTRLKLLDVSPFALKYTLKALEPWRLRPYAVAGLDFLVTITRQDPVSDESLQFTGTAPFDDPLIGGLLAQAPELAARGTPTGQGNIDLGLHAGAGLEIRVARGLSLNVEYRFTAIDAGNNLQALSAALGFHW